VPDPTSTTAPHSEPSVTLDKDSVAGGGQVVVTSSGWAPGTDVAVMLQPEGAALVTTVADAAGSVSVSITVPVGTALGPHVVRLSGIATSGAPQVLSAALEVVASTPGGATVPPATGTPAAGTPALVTSAPSGAATGSLPTTGAPSQALVLLAGFLTAAGCLALLAVRRRS